MVDPKKDKWQVVMNVELESMHDNEVWEEVDLPPIAKVVGSKWIFDKDLFDTFLRGHLSSKL